MKMKVSVKDALIERFSIRATLSENARTSMTERFSNR